MLPEAPREKYFYSTAGSVFLSRWQQKRRAFRCPRNQRISVKELTLTKESIEKVLSCSLLYHYFSLVLWQSLFLSIFLLISSYFHIAAKHLIALCTTFVIQEDWDNVHPKP